MKANAKGENNRSAKLTRKRLGDALIQLLLHKPLQEITVRELAAKANIARGTFYFHYSDIYELLHQIEQDQLDALDALLARLLPRMREATPPDAMEQLFRYILDNSDVCCVLWGANGDPAFTQTVKELVITRCLEYLGVSAGSNDRQRVLISFAVNGFFGSVVGWFEDGRRLSAAEITSVTWEAIHAVEVLVKPER